LELGFEGILADRAHPLGQRRLGHVTLLNLFILALAAWRLGYMIAREDGPYKWIARMRARFSFPALKCVNCLSVWTGALMWLLLFTPLYFVVYILAISGLALMLHRYTGYHVDMPNG